MQHIRLQLMVGWVRTTTAYPVSCQQARFTSYTHTHTEHRLWEHATTVTLRVAVLMYKVRLSFESIQHSSSHWSRVGSEKNALVGRTTRVPSLNCIFQCHSNLFKVPPLANTRVRRRCRLQTKRLHFTHWGCRCFLEEASLLCTSQHSFEPEAVKSNDTDGPQSYTTTMVHSSNL